MVVTTSLPGKTGLEKRTASRFRRLGSPPATVLTTAWLHMAIVQRPWAMMPGRTTLIRASGGMVSAAAIITASQVGTTAKTGGAYLPEVYAGLSSLVAAA